MVFTLKRICQPVNIINFYCINTDILLCLNKAFAVVDLVFSGIKKIIFSNTDLMQMYLFT